MHTEQPTLPKRPFKTIHDIPLGAHHTWSRTFTYDDIERTGTATGDRNPLHFDQVYAAKTRFARPILHGVTMLGEISRVLGMEFPGRGTVFVDLVARFKRPVYPGDTVTFIAIISNTELRWSKLIVDISAMIATKEVLTGKATLILGDDIEAP